MSTIIGCKLPHGITLKGSGGQDVHINGMNTSLVHGGIGLTTVDDNEAAFLFEKHAEFQPFASQAIFTFYGDSVADLAAMAEDLKEEKTGFEGLNPDKPADGMKPADEMNLDQAKAQAAAKPRPALAPASKADKAAAKVLAGKA